jgi:DNA-binding GntR family transcriptional regulator
MAALALPPADRDSVRRSSAEHAARYIRRLIFDGALEPGERVPQDDIAKALGISRIPVREALIALEREGWVTIELHRGAFVNTISPEIVRDHYALYGTICGFAARRALARGAPDFAARLRKISDAMARCSDPVEFSHLAVEFNRTVVAEARNPRIALIVKSLAVLVPGSFFVEVPDTMGVQRRGVAAIVRAAKRVDSQGVAAEYEKLMRQVGERVVELFEAKGLFG